GRVVAAVRAGSGGVPSGDSGAIYYSDNGGTTWTMATGAGTGAVLALAFNGSTQLLALINDGTNAVIYTSADGASFTAGYTSAASTGSGALYHHAGSDTFFVLACDDKLLQSTNAAGGYSFTGAIDRAAGVASPVPLSLGHHVTLAVDPAD